MITLAQYLTSNGKYPSFIEDINNERNVDVLLKNASKTVAIGAEICSRAGLKDPIVTSGWRPLSLNRAIGGSATSKHIACKAVDIWDPDKILGLWCRQNKWALKELGCAFESLDVTHASEEASGRWCHIQTEIPESGNIEFIP